MKKRIFSIVAVLLILASILAVSGCNGGGQMNMVTGRWKLSTAGNGKGGSQEQYPLPVVIDIFPNGTIDLLESPFGKWTRDRDTFTFKSNDGTIDTSGGFKIDYITDKDSGVTTPTMTVYMDNEDVSYVLQKQSDLGPLESMKRAATKAPVAPVATPVPTATVAPSAS